MALTRNPNFQIAKMADIGPLSDGSFLRWDAASASFLTGSPTEGGAAAAVHTHPSTDIRDSTSPGRAILTAIDAAGQRVVLGLGSLAVLNTLSVIQNGGGSVSIDAGGNASQTGNKSFTLGNGMLLDKDGASSRMFSSGTIQYQSNAVALQNHVLNSIGAALTGTLMKVSHGGSNLNNVKILDVCNNEIVSVLTVTALTGGGKVDVRGATTIVGWDTTQPVARFDMATGQTTNAIEIRDASTILKASVSSTGKGSLAGADFQNNGRTGAYIAQTLWSGGGGASNNMIGSQFDRFRGGSARHTLTGIGDSAFSGTFDGTSLSVPAPAGGVITPGVATIDFNPYIGWTPNTSTGYVYANGSIAINFYSTDIASDITVEFYRFDGTADVWTTVATITGNTKNPLIIPNLPGFSWTKKVRLTFSHATAPVNVSSIEYFPTRQQDAGEMTHVPRYDPGNVEMANRLFALRDSAYVRRTKFEPRVIDGASAVAYEFDTQNNLAAAGAKLHSWKNQGIEKASLDFSGSFSGNSYRVNGTKVVGSQQPANPDTTGATLAQLETEVNELKAMLRTHGLIATV